MENKKITGLAEPLHHSDASTLIIRCFQKLIKQS